MQDENVLKQIEEQTAHRPIIAIDTAIEAFRTLEDTSWSKLLELFERAVLSEINVKKTKAQPVEDLFDSSLNTQDQRFVAICFLRLLGIADECFEHHHLRVKIFKSFDKALSEDVYKKARIDAKSQTFQKQAALEPLVAQVVESLERVLGSLNDLRQLGAFRKRLMQVLRSDLTKAIIWPFLPRELLEDARIGEVFATLEEYLSTVGPGQLRIYDRACRVLDRYQSEAEEFGTGFSREFLAGFASRMASLLQEHLEKSGLSRPANVDVVRVEKKYPFHISNQEVRLRLVVRNPGPGHAFETQLTIMPTSDELEVKRSISHLGNIELGSEIALEVPAVLKTPQSNISLIVEVTWTNYDSTAGRFEHKLLLEGQRGDIDWDEVTSAEPYSLEAVETEQDLVGREETLNLLLRMTQAKNLTSSYIYGQKRVGKTSIVKVLAERLHRTQPGKFFVLYLQGGDYVHPDPATTIQLLGHRICSELKSAYRSLEGLEIPEFRGALSPMAEFLDRVSGIERDLRFILVLDEFDELPLELYQRGSVGDSFFLTLRTISGKVPFSFILVGGENMSRIMVLQGDRLNKLRPIRVDYFNREQHWSDFEDLIRNPVAPWLEISDDGLRLLYDESAGNPYFAKLIAGELLNIMTSRRDCHGTALEVNEAVWNAFKNVETNSFEHFWWDAILAIGTEAEEISMRRRRVLLSLANAFRQKDRIRMEDLLNEEYRSNLDDSTVLQELREFEQRNVVTQQDGYYDFTIGFFRKWLVNRGINVLIGSFSGLDATLKRKQEEEKAFVNSEEIVTLCRKWGIYKGRAITEDKVRAWLRQFGDNTKQRIMFKVLAGLHFYSADEIRAKLKEGYGIVVRGLTTQIVRGKRRRGDILVSYLDKVGKSGAWYAKLFADENQIYVDNVIERSQLAVEMGRRTKIQAIVFIDDFVGTGQSAIDYFSKLAQECGDLMRSSGLRFYFIVITGFRTAQTSIEQSLGNNNLPVQVHVCEPLDMSAKCFSDSSQIFPYPNERDLAMNIAYENGVLLDKRNPLGFGDCQTAVVFENSCPNNCLPVLWAESKNWQPLFPRFST